MEPILKVGERGTERWVVGEPTPTPTTAIVARPIDVQSLAIDAMAANNGMVTAILRSMQPMQIDAQPTPPAGLSSRDELHARNQRFRWVVVAVVVLAAITAAGIVTVAFLAGHLSGPAALAGWLVLSGVTGYLSVTYVHSREARLTPENVALTDANARAYAAETDAESRRILAEAYAQSIVDDAAARRASAENARQANMLAAQPLPMPQRREMDYTPRVLEDTIAPDETPQHAPSTPTAQSEMTPDPALVAMLKVIGELYDDAQRRDATLITMRLPWSARGEWAAGDKARAAAVLATFQPPLLEVRDGNRLHLNRQWRRRIAELHIAREWR